MYRVSQTDFFHLFSFALSLFPTHDYATIMPKEQYHAVCNKFGWYTNNIAIILIPKFAGLLTA